MILGFSIGLYFNARSMIGFIALAGIAVNNSIILMEHLNSLKTKKLKIEEALMEAASTRFRPIMLTTITTKPGVYYIVPGKDWGVSHKQL
jgi:multidrug efflux pump subunit AcrB